MIRQPVLHVFRVPRWTPHGFRASGSVDLVPPNMLNFLALSRCLAPVDLRSGVLTLRALVQPGRNSSRSVIQKGNKPICGVFSGRHERIADRRVGVSAEPHDHILLVEIEGLQLSVFKPGGSKATHKTDTSELGSHQHRRAFPQRSDIVRCAPVGIVIAP